MGSRVQRRHRQKAGRADPSSDPKASPTPNERADDFRVHVREAVGRGAAGEACGGAGSGCIGRNIC